MRSFGTLTSDNGAAKPIRSIRRRRELGFILSAAAVLLFVGMMLGAASATFILERQQTETNQKA